MNDRCACDPVYAEPDSSQPQQDGVRKPPGLPPGGLDTIVEESDNNAVELANETRLALKELQAVVDELRRDNAELLRWKNQVSARVLVDETPKSYQDAHPPLIPPMPKEFSFAFTPKRKTTEAFANGDVDRVEKSPNAVRELPAPVKAPTFGKFDANMNLNNGFVHKNTTFPTFNFSNSATPTFAPQVPTSFNFSGTSSSAAQEFRYSAPICEPTKELTPRRKFEDSLASSVKDFFERSEKRQSAKMPVAATMSRPDSNPFRIHLGNDVDFEQRRETAPPQLPPPLPPRSSPAKKPWEHLMGPETQEKSAPSATKLIYEGPPIFYARRSKAANHSSRLGPAFPEEEDFASSSQAKLTVALAKTRQIRREDFAQINRENASLSERFHSPSGTFVNNSCPETPEDSNLRLFNESYSAQRSTSSTVKESTIPDLPTNVKATKKDPPPLPPRPFTFDFNSLSFGEQNRYTEWLQAPQYSDSFENEESLARNGWKWMNANDARTVAPAVNREIKGTESVDRKSSLKTVESAIREITPKRVVHAKMEDEKDPCQFKAYPLPHCTIYIFNLDGEGWLATEEFAAEFTNFHALTMVNILKTMSIFIPYRTLSRSENRPFFEKLERTSLCVARDENGKIGDILHLTPLRSTIKILRKLRLITDDEVQRAMKERIYPEEPKTLLHMVMVIQEYSKFQQSLQ